MVFYRISAMNLNDPLNHLSFPVLFFWLDDDNLFPDGKVLVNIGILANLLAHRFWSDTGYESKNIWNNSMQFSVYLNEVTQEVFLLSEFYYNHNNISNAFANVKEF